MAVAVTLDIFGETEQQYEQVIAAFFPDGKLPDGWLVRLAGPTENGSPGATRLGETAAAPEALNAVSDQQRDRSDLRVAAAALLLAEGSPQQAVDVLAPLLEGSAPIAHPVAIMWALLLAAAAHDRLGDGRSAEAAVERAAGLAQPDGNVLPFTRHRTAHAGSSRPQRRGEPAPALEQLSDAELRVLRYLPSNLKAPEIAAELYRSVHTVKTHLRHIYAKLDAHNRTEAVDRARELGLLAPSSRLR